MTIVSTTVFKSRGLVFHPRFHIAVRSTSDEPMRTWPSFPPTLRSRHPPRSGVCPVQGRAYRVGGCSITSPHAMGRHTSFFGHHIRQSSPLHCGPGFHPIGTSRCPSLFHRSAKSRCAPKSPIVALPVARIFSPRNEPAPTRRDSEPTLSCGRWRGRRRGSRGPQLGPSCPCRRSWPRLLAGRAPPPPPRGRRASGPATAARAKTLCPAPQSGRLLVWLSWL